MRFTQCTLNPHHYKTVEVLLRLLSLHSYDSIERCTVLGVWKFETQIATAAASTTNSLRLSGINTCRKLFVAKKTEVKLHPLRSCWLRSIHLLTGYQNIKINSGRDGSRDKDDGGKRDREASHHHRITYRLAVQSYFGKGPKITILCDVRREPQ